MVIVDVTVMPKIVVNLTSLYSYLSKNNIQALKIRTWQRVVQYMVAAEFGLL